MISFLLAPVLAFVFLIACYACWLASAGPKLTVLYLRRFRLNAAQNVVTSALERGLSRRYRVVTLDDASFPPMETPRLYRRLSRYGGAVGWSVVLGGLFLLVWTFYASSSPTITGMISSVALAGLLVLVAPVVLPVVTVVAILFTAALLVQRWRVRRRSRLEVRTEEDLDRAEEAVSRLAQWSTRSTLLAPRATVVRVTDDLWQVVVERMVRRTNVILVDLSVPTENLRWELALLDRLAQRGAVFIADRHAQAALEPPEGEECIAYDDFKSSSDRRKFLSVLTRALDSHARWPPLPGFRDCALAPAVTMARLVLWLSLGSYLTYHLILTLGQAIAMGRDP